MLQGAAFLLHAGGAPHVESGVIEERVSVVGALQVGLQRGVGRRVGWSVHHVDWKDPVTQTGDTGERSGSPSRLLKSLHLLEARPKVLYRSRFCREDFAVLASQVLDFTFLWTRVQLVRGEL